MNNAFTYVTGLLAKREYGEHELAEKLMHKGYAEAEIQDAILECKRLGLQSDVRFAESLCRTRIRQGYGPLRIRQELRSKQVDFECIEDALQHEKVDWFMQATQVKNKKYSDQGTITFNHLQKQKRFLLYRGFPQDIIAQVFKNSHEVVRK